MKTVIIDGEEYVRKSDVTSAVSEGLQYAIIRSSDSGCWAGYVEDVTGSTVTLLNARRLWYWSGAASLSQLAMEGVSKPRECKFPIEVSQVTVLGVCEIIDATEAARKSIAEVPVWSA